MKDENLLAAFEVLEELRQTPDKIIAYHSYLKTIIDEEARIDAARHYGWEDGWAHGIEEGRKEVRKKGMEKGIKEVVRNLLALGVDVATIQAASGLTEQQITQIQQQLEKEQQGES